MTGPVPIRLEAALIRGLLPDLVLREGTLLAARVLERNALSLAGRQIAAELPETLLPGQEVRLRVEEATPERVVLRVVTEPQAAPVALPPLLPLPGGLEARIAVRRDAEAERSEGRDAASVAITYDSPALGEMGFRLALDAAALRATVELPAGASEAAREAADELREALAAATGRPAEVRIVERREPVDVYA